MKSLLRRLMLAGLLCAWAVLTLVLLWPALAGWQDQRLAPRPPNATGADYLVVAPERLAASAQAWADYRRERGYAVRVVALAPPDVTVERIRAAIQDVYNTSDRPAPFYVLLLGHAHAFVADGYLPAPIIPLNLPQALIDEAGFADVASDGAYALDDAAHLLLIDIGRVPATNDAEALDVLARTRTYEAHPPTGSGRAQVELLASESRFGPIWDQVIESLIVFFVEQHLPDTYRWHLLYGHAGSQYNYPMAEFPQEAARRMNQGALLVAYIGHGGGDWLGPAAGPGGEEGRIFAGEDVPAVTNGQASVVMMIACSAGEYDRDWSLAERLLLQPGGPVATYAASRITLPAANTILGKDLFRGLLAERASTTGEWIRRAESNYRNPGADRALSLWLLSRAVPPLYELSIRGHDDETPPLDADLVYGLQQHAYNLFGDPALALATARESLDLQPGWPWQPGSGRATFSGHGAPAGQVVTVTLYTSQALILPQPSVPDDLPARYAHANDKTVAQVIVTAGADGAFAGALDAPAGLPGGHYILEALSTAPGETRVGSHVVYFGWAPLGELLGSVAFWWIVVSALAAWRLQAAFSGRRRG
jgi:hypothetical protein